MTFLTKFYQFSLIPRPKNPPMQAFRLFIIRVCPFPFISNIPSYLSFLKSKFRQVFLPILRHIYPKSLALRYFSPRSGKITTILPT